MASHINDGLRVDISYVDNISRQSHYKSRAPSVFFWLQNCQWLRSPHCSLASGAFLLPMPWLFARDTSITILPPVSLLSTQDTLALYGYPWALWSARTRGQPLNWWSLSGQRHCNHLGLLHISLHWAFWVNSLLLKTKYSNWSKSFIGLWGPAAAFWILHLISGSDWAMKCIAQRTSPSGEEGSMLIYFLKVSTYLLWKTAGFSSCPCWTSLTFS